MARGWSDLRADFPADGSRGAVRAQSSIVAAVRAGDFVEPQWCTVELRHPTLPLTAFYDVMCDAFKIGRPGDSVRINPTHATSQVIADLLRKRLLTSKIVDQRSLQAEIFIEPVFQQVTSSIAGMDEHSRAIDARIAGRTGLKGGMMKWWINHPRLANPSAEEFGKDTAINYAWLTKAKTGAGGKKPWPSASAPAELRTWQQPGGRHNAGIADVNTGHTDRSQGLLLGAEWLTVVEGGISTTVPVDLAALDPILSGLVSADGPVLMRHPWIPRCQTLAEGGACPIVPPPAPPPPPKRKGAGVATAGAVVAGGALAWYLLAHG